MVVRAGRVPLREPDRRACPPSGAVAGLRYRMAPPDKQATRKGQSVYDGHWPVFAGCMLGLVVVVPGRLLLYRYLVVGEERHGR